MSRLADVELDWPRLVLAGLVVALVLSAGVAAATSQAAFGLYNPDWDGTSDVRAALDDDPGVEATVVREADAYAAFEPESTVAIVVAPDEPYADRDAERVRAFVEAGGTLVVLENFEAPGEALLAAVGAEARPDGRLLLDEHRHSRGPAMPVATGVEPHPLTDGVDQLTLNYATAIEPGNATPVVTSSEYGYLGADAADEPGDDDELAAYPVVTVEAVGAGTVVAGGDPSIVINTMYAEPDNARFVENLVADADHVAVDLSHAEALPPLRAALLTLRASALLQALVGLALVAGAIAAARPVGALSRVLPATDREPVEPVERRQPDREADRDGRAEPSSSR